MPRTLEGYCEDCKEEREFRYVGGNAAVGQMEAYDYYACDCGRTYRIKDLITLRAAYKISTQRK